MPGIVGARAFYIIEYWQREYWPAYAGEGGSLARLLGEIVERGQGRAGRLRLVLRRRGRHMAVCPQASVAPAGDLRSDRPQHDAGPGHRADRLPAERLLFRRPCAITPGRSRFRPARRPYPRRPRSSAGKCTECGSAAIPTPAAAGAAVDARLAGRAGRPESAATAWRSINGDALPTTGWASAALVGPSTRGWRCRSRWPAAASSPCRRSLLPPAVCRWNQPSSTARSTP